MSRKNQHLPKALTDSTDSYFSRFQTYQNQVQFDLYRAIKMAKNPQKESSSRHMAPGFDPELIEIRTRG